MYVSICLHSMEHIEVAQYRCFEVNPFQIEVKSRLQMKIFKKNNKKDKNKRIKNLIFVNFHYPNWIQHEESIKMSKSNPSIGSEVLSITVDDVLLMGYKNCALYAMKHINYKAFASTLNSTYLEIWLGQGCTAQALKPLAIFKVILEEKVTIFRDFYLRGHFSYFSFECLHGDHLKILEKWTMCRDIFVKNGTHV